MRHRTFFAAQVVELVARMIPEDRNASNHVDMCSNARFDYLGNDRHESLLGGGLISDPRPLDWRLQCTFVALAAVILVRFGALIRTQRKTKMSLQTSSPSQVPYYVPVIGNSLSYILDAAKLASSITQRFGPSTVARLNLVGKEIFVVSGADFLNALWKNTKGLTSTNGINIALHNMFDTPKQDMSFFEADNSGITHDPHPGSSTRSEDRVFYLMHKATVDCLAGSHLTIADQVFQAALARRSQAIPVQEDWVEMDDLFDFLRPLISYSTVEAMCGIKFLERYPDFVDAFWDFNSRMPRLLQGWPRWMMPKAWQARDRCISMMKDWRAKCSKDDFDGNEMILRRWSYFAEMNGLSDDGVACSDLGILWGMNSNSMPATFWLIWHMFRDRSLLQRASEEVNACKAKTSSEQVSFDVTKLSSQPLLQSCYAETLRKYVAVYIIRKPVYEDASVLNYIIPKNKMIVVSSAIAHMDQRNWNLGLMGQHPVDDFWGERFLTHAPKQSEETAPESRIQDKPSLSAINSESDLQKPRFSLNGYSGKWVPFGGGIHQCPGRHWVKLQMLVTFAVIHEAFDIEILDSKDKLNVDLAKYGLGALQPSEKVAFRIRRKSAA